MLYNLCNEFPVNHSRLHLLRHGPFDEITVFDGRHRDVDATALAGDDFDHLHTFLGEVYLARVGCVDLDGRDRPDDLDFERGRRGDG